MVIVKMLIKTQTYITGIQENLKNLYLCCVRLCFNEHWNKAQQG